MGFGETTLAVVKREAARVKSGRDEVCVEGSGNRLPEQESQLCPLLGICTLARGFTVLGFSLLICKTEPIIIVWLLEGWWWDD